MEELLAYQGQDRIQVDLVDQAAHQGLDLTQVGLAEQEVDLTEELLVVLELELMVQLVEQAVEPTVEPLAVLEVALLEDQERMQVSARNITSNNYQSTFRFVEINNSNYNFLFFL